MNAQLYQNGRHLCDVKEITTRIPGRSRLGEKQVFWVSTASKPEVTPSVEHVIQIPEFQEAWSVKIKDIRPVGDEFVSEAILLRLRSLRQRKRWPAR